MMDYWKEDSYVYCKEKILPISIKDLKDSLNTNSGASYSINGITYDDESNITSAVETLVKAARMERRI